MSGDGKRDHAKSDCGGSAKAPPIIHRPANATAPVLDSTPTSVHSQDDVASRHAAAERFYEATNPSTNFDETLQRMYPSLSSNQRRAVVTKLLNPLREPTIDVFAQTYTVEELDAATAFYRPPIGEFVQTKMPDFNATMIERIMPFLKRAAERAVR